MAECKYLPGFGAMQPAQPVAQTAHESDRKMDHAIRAARAFDRACQLTGLSSVALCRQLAPMIGKPNALSRQTLLGWRRGKQPVPMAAFLAACDLAGLRPPLIFALAAEEPAPS